MQSLKTPTAHASNSPYFGHRVFFPFVLTAEMLERLEKQRLVLEVWDQVSPSRDELVGLVKL